VGGKAVTISYFRDGEENCLKGLLAAVSRKLGDRPSGKREARNRGGEKASFPFPRLCYQTLAGEKTRKKKKTWFLTERGQVNLKKHEPLGERGTALCLALGVYAFTEEKICSETRRVASGQGRDVNKR